MLLTLHKVFEDIKAFWLCGKRPGSMGVEEAALCSFEQHRSEVIGYVDAVSIGESLQVVLNILQNNMLLNEGDFLLMGDILSGIHTFAVT